jgi:prolipoprotein diacylglyceryl transferase
MFDYLINLIAAITWNVDPTIFKIWHIQPRWYGLLFALSFVAGYHIMQKIFLKEGKTIKQLESLTYTMIASTVIGARLGHCLFYDPVYYLSNPLEILMVWEGGLASHGAAVGIILGLWLYIRKQKDMSLLWILDRIVIVVALSGLFIRLGNFFNSEILGRAADVPWAVIFPRVDDIPRHPAQLYEAFSYFGIFIYLYMLYLRSGTELKQGKLFGLFLILVFGARFIIEFFKEVQSAFEIGLPLDMGQILSIPFVLAGFYFVFRKK